jgi:hypothetical protein
MLKRSAVPPRALGLPGNETEGRDAGRIDGLLRGRQ